jgi:hypothetical protein
VSTPAPPPSQCGRGYPESRGCLPDRLIQNKPSLIIGPSAEGPGRKLGIRGNAQSARERSLLALPRIGSSGRSSPMTPNAGEVRAYGVGDIRWSQMSVLLRHARVDMSQLGGDDARGRCSHSKV